MTKNQKLINGMTEEEFLKKMENRRFTVQVRLINQDGEEEWGDYSRVWKNEDVAISHLNLLGTLLEESTKKENMWWGTLMGDGKEKERIFKVLEEHLVSSFAESEDDYLNCNKEIENEK